MGTTSSTFSNDANSPQSGHSGTAANADSFNTNGFNKIESNHLNSLRHLVCQETSQKPEHASEESYLYLTWKCCHLLAATATLHTPQLSRINNISELEAKVSTQMEWIEKRCHRMTQVLKICPLLQPALNDELERIFNPPTEKDSEGIFLEFASNMTWRHGRGYNQNYSLDFGWNVVNRIDSTDETNASNSVAANDIICFYFQIALALNYLLLPESVTDLSLEPRDIDAEKDMVQSMAKSLLEYAKDSRSGSGFGSHDFGSNGNTPASSSTNATAIPEGSVTKREFSEWQRKILPDFLFCSIVQFFQVLFFPPERKPQNEQMQQKPMWEKSSAIFRQYPRPFPVLRSSKEVMSGKVTKTGALASGIGIEEVLPITSSIFGPNFRGKSDNSLESNSRNGNVATALLSPSIFAFVSISTQKFGGKWYRIYAGAEDGWALNQLEHAIIGYHGPTLLLIQASSLNNKSKGTVTFGAYAASKWEKNKKDFFGSSDCFLFQLRPTLRVLHSLPKMGTRGGHYMYFNSSMNVTNNKKEDLAQGLGFGGTVRSPRLFVDCSLEECRVSSQDTSFEEGQLGFPPSDDLFSSTSNATSSQQLHIDSLEIWAVGDDETLRQGFQAQHQHRDIADAALRNARTVDKAAFLGDLRNGTVESKAFAHRGQVDGRAHGCLKGEEDGKANGL